MSNEDEIAAIVDEMNRETLEQFVQDSVDLALDLASAAIPGAGPIFAVSKYLLKAAGVDVFHEQDRFRKAVADIAIEIDLDGLSALFNTCDRKLLQYKTRFENRPNNLVQAWDELYTRVDDSVSDLRNFVFDRATIPPEQTVAFADRCLLLETTVKLEMLTYPVEVSGFSRTDVFSLLDEVRTQMWNHLRQAHDNILASSVFRQYTMVSTQLGPGGRPANTVKALQWSTWYKMSVVLRQYLFSTILASYRSVPLGEVGLKDFDQWIQPTEYLQLTSAHGLAARFPLLASFPGGEPGTVSGVVNATIGWDLDRVVARGEPIEELSDDVELTSMTGASSGGNYAIVGEAILTYRTSRKKDRTHFEPRTGQTVIVSPPDDRPWRYYAELPFVFEARRSEDREIMNDHFWSPTGIPAGVANEKWKRRHFEKLLITTFSQDPRHRLAFDQGSNSMLARAVQDSDAVDPSERFKVHPGLILYPAGRNQYAVESDPVPGFFLTAPESKAEAPPAIMTNSTSAKAVRFRFVPTTLSPRWAGPKYYGIQDLTSGFYLTVTADGDLEWRDWFDQFSLFHITPDFSWIDFEAEDLSWD